jgi:hypothetical protein
MRVTNTGRAMSPYICSGALGLKSHSRFLLNRRYPIALAWKRRNRGGLYTIGRGRQFDDFRCALRKPAISKDFSPKGALPLGWTRVSPL